MRGLGALTAGVAGTGVVGLVAKATLVLCLALALAWLARRGSARTLQLCFLKRTSSLAMTFPGNDAPLLDSLPFVW